MTRPVTLITGASGGIGSALAHRLATDGHRLVLTGRREAALSALSGELEARGAQVAALVGDVAEQALPQACVDRAIERFGRLDALVCAAGASRARPFLELDADWDDLLDVNLSAPFRFALAAARPMIAQGDGGAIVFASSVSAANGGANLAYGAAKAGLESLTRGMARQLGSHRIRTNAVTLGIVDTDMIRDAVGKGMANLAAEVASRVPAGRLCRPEEVAGLIAFMLSPEAGYMTGACVPLTGGLDIPAPLTLAPKAG